jgi:hypothetical protein
MTATQAQPVRENLLDPFACVNHRRLDNGGVRTSYKADDLKPINVLPRVAGPNAEFVALKYLEAGYRAGWLTLIDDAVSAGAPVRAVCACGTWLAPAGSAISQGIGAGRF